MTAADDRAAQIRADIAAFCSHTEEDILWLLAERDELLRRAEQAERAEAERKFSPHHVVLDEEASDHRYDGLKP